MDYLALIEKKIGREDAEAKISQKIEGFHGLLTREAAPSASLYTSLH